jgi:dimethylargininase
MFQHAIVRIPGSNFADGLTGADLGMPDFATALRQHVQYCEALTTCGLEVVTLAADLAHPDSTFVEDTAVLTPQAAILARPGAPSRAGEVSAIREVIDRFFPTCFEVQAPGTLDGGDICEAGAHFFLGLSQRSNEEGLRQLAGYLDGLRYTASIIDVRDLTCILHLKSGIAYLGDNTLVLIEEFAGHPQFKNYKCIVVSAEESYAANCVRVNDRVLIPSGNPKLLAQLEATGFYPLSLDMSEFRKMDGGLSCLSLRF